MYDMSKFLPRYFSIKLKNEKTIDVEPPKLKVLKKIMSLSKVQGELTEENFDDIIKAVSMALSKNKQNYEVNIEWLTENHNIDELMELLTHYFDWVNEINDSKN